MVEVMWQRLWLRSKILFWVMVVLIVFWRVDVLLVVVLFLVLKVWIERNDEVGMDLYWGLDWMQYCLLEVRREVGCGLGLIGFEKWGVLVLWLRRWFRVQVGIVVEFDVLLSMVLFGFWIVMVMLLSWMFLMMRFFLVGGLVEGVQVVLMVIGVLLKVLLKRVMELMLMLFGLLVERLRLILQLLMDSLWYVQFQFQIWMMVVL